MKELLIFVYDTCCISEVSVIAWMMNTEENYQIRTVAISKSPVTSLEGWVLIPDCTIDELNPIDTYLGLIFPGGIEITLPSALKDLILEFDRKNILLGAICAGPTFLALAGILPRYRYTTSLTPLYYEEDNIPDPFPRENFLIKRYVKDRHVITAKGEALMEFTDLVLEYLHIYPKEYDQQSFRKDFTPIWNTQSQI